MTPVTVTWHVIVTPVTVTWHVLLVLSKAHFLHVVSLPVILGCIKLRIIHAKPKPDKKLSMAQDRTRFLIMLIGLLVHMGFFLFLKSNILP